MTVHNATVMQSTAHRPGFPFQLKCFYTGEAAPERIRVKVQESIDRQRERLGQTTNESERCSIRVAIMRLEGKLSQVRA